MPFTVSPYYYDPEMGKIAGNLATAIFGDPEARMKRDLYGAQTERQMALTGKTNEETHRLRTGNNQFDELPQIQADMVPLPGETPMQTFARTAFARGRMLQAYPGSNVNQAADAGNSMIANVFAQGGDDDKRTSMVMQGKNVDEDFSGTDARADAVLNNKGGWKDQTERGVANIKAGADKAVATINQGGQNTRFFGAPITAKPGDTITLAPNDPRRGKIGDKDGVLQGSPTKVTVEGQAGTRMLNGESSPTLNTLFSGNVRSAQPGGPNSARSRVVRGKDMEDAVAAAALSIGGGSRQGNKIIVDPNFESAFEGAKYQQARVAAGDAFAKTGNVQAASQAFLDTLGVQPGAKFGKQGGFFGVGGHYGVTPAAPAAPAAPAGPAAPGVVTAPGQLPPPAQRPMGMEIDSPRGRVKWNGAGWVPVQTAPVY